MLPPHRHQRLPRAKVAWRIRPAEGGGGSRTGRWWPAALSLVLGARRWQRSHGGSMGAAWEPLAWLRKDVWWQLCNCGFSAGTASASCSDAQTVEDLRSMRVCGAHALCRFKSAMA